MRAIAPRPLAGTVRIIPSKSASHRALLTAALAQGRSEIAPLQRSEDVDATLCSLAGMGLARVEAFAPMQNTVDGDYPLCRCVLAGGRFPVAPRVAPCGESGSTLRFLMPLALDGRGPVRFEGKGRLLDRPLMPYRDLFAAQGVRWAQDEASITLEGTLRSGSFALPGDVSSQFVTGLLLALPGLAGDSTIHLTTEVASRGYIDLTLEALARRGIRAAWRDERTLAVPGGQRAVPGAAAVEGDWSHAAFYLVAGLLGGPVRLTGLAMDSAQGDRAIVDILRAMGGDITQEEDALVARHSRLRGAEIDCQQVPDLVPALAVAACAAQGRTVLCGAARLRLKESDRLAALEAELGALGARVQATADGLIIDGGAPLCGARVDGHNDHRIAMALAVAAPLCASALHLRRDAVVRKSAPAFWAEYSALGGDARPCGEAAQD